MAFGLTACNPQSVYSDSLPEDSHLLLDRPEYWVVKKDIANNPVAKDILAFTLSATGKLDNVRLISSKIVKSAHHFSAVGTYFKISGRQICSQ